MTRLRRILREPVFSGHPVLADTSPGPEGVRLIQVWLYYHAIFEHQPPNFLQIHLNPSRILIIENMTSMNSSTVSRLAPTQRPTWPPISPKIKNIQEKALNSKLVKVL